MDAHQIRKTLNTMVDPYYLKFHTSLCPGCMNILGIRTPFLKKYAKKLSKEADIINYMDSPLLDYAEEIMLFGFILSNLKITDEQRLPYLETYASHISSWAVCDSPVASFKFIQKNREFYYPMVLSYLHSSKEYEVRFAIVTLLDHYMTDNYIDSILELMSTTQHEGYYVKMAIAWTLSVCYIHYPEKTIKLLEFQQLNAFIHNKAIQKISESLRVSKDEKEALRKLKITPQSQSDSFS